MSQIIRTATEWIALDLEQYRRPAHVRGVLMCEPSFFDVVDVRNAHMREHVGSVDRAAAAQEWDGLVEAFRRDGLEVDLLPADPDLVDMVFTANPCLTGVDREGEPFVILARMRHDERAAEVDHHRRWFERSATKIVELPADFEGAWEGGGDTVWHPGHAILWGGYGERSDPEILPWLAAELGIPIAALELVDPSFYHLDTCFAALGDDSAAWIPSAFSARSQELLSTAFMTLVEVDRGEGETAFAGNLFCPNGSTVFLPADSPRTRVRLEGIGLKVIDVRTDEYLKSGGSIYCMRQNLYRDI